MPEKDPTTYSLLTYAWVFLLSGWGGFVSFMRKVKSGQARAWNFVELVGELATSSLAGLLTFYLAENAGFSPLLTAALVGISGHMGSRALFMLEKRIEKWLPADRSSDENPS